MSHMRITVNGQFKSLAASANLKTVIEQLSAGNSRVIAEVNGAIVKPSSWEKTAIKEGDTLELVNLVGGG